jgi:peptidoglycan/xylan/chitin deacetylase (PgdA/CDA1 family)
MNASKTTPARNPRPRRLQRRWILAVFIALAGGAAGAICYVSASPPPPEAGLPRIARWHHDATAAISFTFDDGLQCHRDKAMPLLDAFDFKATFFVIAGKMREHRADTPVPDPRLTHGEGALSWDEVKELHADGQEIGDHSLDHTFLDQITDQQQLEHEINDAANLITAHLGTPPLTFAFPYNQFTPLAHEVVLQRHLAARERWTDYGGDGFTAEKANALVLETLGNQAWLVPMIHGIDTGFSPVSTQVLRDHLAFVRQHEPQLWVDTYADVVRYQQEFHAASLQVLESRPGELEFSLTCPPDVARDNMPLTIIVPVATDADDQIDARRNDQPLEFTRQADRILLDVPPGNSPICLTWN